MNIHTHVSKQFFLRLLTFAVLFLYLGSTASALTQAQRDTILSGARYFNTEEDGTLICASQAAPATTQQGSVYMIGDSLTVGMQSSGQIEQKFNTASRQVTKIQATTGISVPASVSIVQSPTERANIVTAKTVVVALGTNDGGSTGNGLGEADFALRIDAMIKAIKAVTPTAQIYWMNAYKDGSPNAYAGINAAIRNQASTLGYSVIDWNTEAKANPTKYRPFDNALMVHPNSHYSELADFVVSSVGSANGAANTVAGCACSASSASTLVGSTNAEQAWNYFKSQGLSDVQTAAILGNMKRESGINPRRVQNTRTPEGDSDVNPLDGRTGYGIVQWTDIGRQRGLSQYANDTNRPVSSLDLQLDYVYKEMSEGPVLNNLKSITGTDNAAITAATIYFEESYERSADVRGDAGMTERIRGAITYHNLYSGATAIDDPSPGTPICNPGTGPGQACTSGDIIGWSLSGSCAMVSYDQGDPKWANLPYGAGQTAIAESGCGPTSLAMVGATLLRDSSITPATVATRYGDQYHIPGTGTSWALFPRYAQDTGLNFRDLGTDLNAAADIIRNGGLVVISVDPGHFTGNGHLMVIRAITPDGSGFYIADPNGDGYSNDSETRAFSADFLRTTGNMKHLWGYTK